MSSAPDDAPILVTAAGGTVGSALVAELRAGGHRVRGAFRSQAAAAIAAAAGIDTLMVNLDDPARLPAAVEGVAAVFLIAPTGPRQPDQELSLIAASRAAGVRRVVKLSVWRADELLTPIARLHRPGEEALEASDLSWTLLRPNFYMQNFLRQMATRIKNDGVIAQPECRAPTSFIDARDIASVAAQVLTSDRETGRTYSLTGPHALTYEAAAETFSRVLGKAVRFVGLSDEQAKADMVARGLPRSYAETLVAVNQAYRDGGADTVTSAVRDLTGREPISLEQFVRDHRASFT